jgi:surface antigen
MLIRPPRTAALPALSPRPPQLHRRHRPSAGVVTLIAAGVALLCSICGVTPLGQVGANAGAQNLSVWAAQSGAVDCGGGAAPGQEAPPCAGPPNDAATNQTPVVTPTPTGTPASEISPAPFQRWPPTDPWTAVPGHSTYYAPSPDSYYWWTYGQCTYWAQQRRREDHWLPERDLRRMGDAWSWAIGAQKRGYPIEQVPQPGATVVFAPRVQGAGRGGHVAHVEAVYPDEWFLISEMNFYASGGGWRRVDYRFAHAGAGVWFIL